MKRSYFIVSKQDVERSSTLEPSDIGKEAYIDNGCIVFTGRFMGHLGLTTPLKRMNKQGQIVDYFHDERLERAYYPEGLE